jgi:hypothetical protein
LEDQDTILTQSAMIWAVPQEVRKSSESMKSFTDMPKESQKGITKGQILNHSPVVWAITWLGDQTQRSSAERAPIEMLSLLNCNRARHTAKGDFLGKLSLDNGVFCRSRIMIGREECGRNGGHVEADRKAVKGCS